jgi:predicted nucleotidyltransferase
LTLRQVALQLKALTLILLPFSLAGGGEKGVRTGVTIVTSTLQAAPANKIAERLSHLTPNERAALAALVDRLRQRYGDDLLRVVLFGSKARGDFDDESDLDLLIVVRMRDGNYRQYWNEIVDLTWDIELTYSIVTSLVIKSETDYATMRLHGLLLSRNIEQDGIELWTTQPSAPISEYA